MSDISMCQIDTCENASSCYRFTAIPSDRQSYMQPSNPGKNCEYYWNDVGFNNTKLKVFPCLPVYE